MDRTLSSQGFPLRIERLVDADASEDRTFRTNVFLIFLGSNMLVILLITSSVFTNWISQNFEKANSSMFNPYLVSDLAFALKKREGHRGVGAS